MTDFIFISVAFGPRYVEQQKRLHESILQFYSADHHIQWTDTLPPGSKSHSESLYGFKVHAVKHALDKGYKRIIWVDPACIVKKPVEYYFELGLPIIAAKDDNLLKNHIATSKLMWWSATIVPAAWHLVGGSLYVFDFTHPDCEKIFNIWYACEQAGGFGSQKELSSERINKHRSDESCLAMALYTNGYEPIGCDVAQYCSGDMIIDKKHFK
jgi:hypothetical protein